MIALARPLRHARLAVLATALDADPAGGVLCLYAGVRPAPDEGPVDALLLARCRLAWPCAAAIDDGVLAFAPIADTLALATGTPTWARLADGAGRTVGDLDAGAPGSDAEVIVTPLPLYAGGAVRVALATLID